jgi:hypothetical protein
MRKSAHRAEYFQSFISHWAESFPCLLYKRNPPSRLQNKIGSQKVRKPSGDNLLNVVTAFRIRLSRDQGANGEAPQCIADRKRRFCGIFPTHAPLGRIPVLNHIQAFCKYPNCRASTKGLASSRQKPSQILLILVPFRRQRLSPGGGRSLALPIGLMPIQGLNWTSPV